MCEHYMKVLNRLRKVFIMYKIDRVITNKYTLYLSGGTLIAEITIQNISSVENRSIFDYIKPVDD